MKVKVFFAAALSALAAAVQAGNLFSNGNFASQSYGWSSVGGSVEVHYYTVYTDYAPTCPSYMSSSSYVCELESDDWSTVYQAITIPAGTRYEISCMHGGRGAEDSTQAGEQVMSIGCIWADSGTDVTHANFKANALPLVKLSGEGSVSGTLSTVSDNQWSHVAAIVRNDSSSDRTAYIGFSGVSGGDSGWGNLVAYAYVGPQVNSFIYSYDSLYDGLVAWYKFDGNANDSSGNGNHLSVMSGSAANASDRHGLPNSAYSLDGSATLGCSAGVLVEDSFTISCWVSAGQSLSLANESTTGTSGTGRGSIVGPAQTQDVSTHVGCGVSVGNNGINIVEHYSSYKPAVLRYDSDLGSSWHLVTLIVSNNGVPQLFVDGVFVKSGVQSGRSKCIYLGRDRNGDYPVGYYFNGAMDDLRIYNRALSAAEVAALYAGTTMTYAGFIPTTKVKLCSGGSALDIVGATGYFCSGCINVPGDVSACNFKVNGTTVTAQFQKADDLYTKCLGVEFTTESDGVYVRAVYSRYRDGTSHLGEDFDTGSYSSNHPVTSEYATNGYGVKNLRVQMVAGATTSARGYVQTGLMGQWDGIENAGYGVHDSAASTWVDLSGHGYNATKQGSYGEWKDNSFVFTRSGTGYFSTPSGFQATLGSSWTVEAYVKPTAAARSNYAGICGAHDESYSNGAAIQAWENQLVAFVQGRYHTLTMGKLSIVDADDVWPAGQNLHIAVSVDNATGEAKAFLNGALCDEQTMTPGAAPTLEIVDFWIGRAYNQSNRQFDGNIYAVRAYNRALSAAEIAQNYALDQRRFSGLIHRWSFNGSLADSVGGATARNVGSAAIQYTADGKSLSLPGGRQGTSGVDLGANLLPTDGTPVTIEIWAKNRAIQRTSRIFDMGDSVSGHGNDAFLATWTVGTSLNSDAVDLYESEQEVNFNRNRICPYNLNTEYHISVTISQSKLNGGRTSFIYAKRNAETGAVLATTSWETSVAWSLGDLTQDVFYLGRSQWAGDGDASADYNEVRIWNRVLSEAELTRNAQLGPDVLPYVQVEAAPYTVRYNKNDGSGTTATQSFEVGEMKALVWLTSGLGWSYSGYSFLGWALSSGSTEVAYGNGAKVRDIASSGSTLDLYAVWLFQGYTVRFHKNDGSATTLDQTMLRGSVRNLYWMDSQIGWKRTGYTFAGWARTASSTTVAYSNGQAVTNLGAADATVDLYAVWKPITYAVRFHKNDGTATAKDQTFTYGRAQNLLYKDSALGWSVAGCTFAGWARTVDGAVAYSNGQRITSNLASAQGAVVHLYAVWNYTVTLKRNASADDKTASTVVCRYGTTATIPWMDSGLKWKRTGYAFAGWGAGATSAVAYANGGKATGVKTSATLYAQWKPITYTVRYHRRNTASDATTRDQAFTYDRAQCLLYKDSQLKWDNAGFDFLGWATATNSTTARFTNGQTVTNLASAQGAVFHLYALWQGKPYTVRFNKNDGTGAKVSKTFRYRTAQKLPYKDSVLGWSRTGYDFLGWARTAGATKAEFSNGQTVTDIAAIGATLELYAVWKAHSYTIVLNYNDGRSDLIREVPATYGQEVQLPWGESGLKWRRTGKTFLGWATTRTATAAAYANGAKVKNLTAVGGGTVELYAVWR